MHTLSRLTLIVLLLASAAATAKIYKWVLPDGSIAYSDQPQVEGAQAVELPRLQTYTAPPVPPPAQTAPPTADLAATYKSLTIVQPGPDESIRDNGGTVSVQLAVEPALATGHVVEILLDGKSIGSGRATSASVSNVDRGSHTLSATVKDADGKVLASANAVTFHLLRASKQNK